MASRPRLALVLLSLLAVLALAPSTAAALLGLRVVMDQSASEPDTGPLKAALLGELGGLIAEFNAMRAQEGAGQTPMIQTTTERL